MATDAVQTQVVREAPEIEAFKRGLLESSLAQVNAINQAASEGRYLTPGYQIAGMSQDQLDAIAAGQAGIGAYQPFLSMGAGQLAAARGTTQEALEALRGADTRSQFAAAQEAMNRAAPALTGVGRAAVLSETAGKLGAAPTAAATTVDPLSALNYYSMGPAERVGTQSLVAPGTVESFMSPYMQNVVDIEKREAARQSAIAGQQEAGKFARAGAFGGARQAIVEAERARNLGTQMGDIQSRGLQSAYQQAQQQFNAEQQARLQAALANQQAGLTTGQQNLAAQLGVQQLGAQTDLQRLLANQQAQQQIALANQQMQGQYGIQGAQLGLQGAQQMGNLYGQQAGLYQNLGQGIGSLAGQQYGIGSQLAQGIGSLGAQQGNLAGLGGALGQQAQAMGQQDVNFLYNLGAQQQRQQQAILDAQRQNALQQNMQPIQMLGFLSDIYKGAPTTQMGMTQQSTPTPSPFQQIAGLGIAGVSAGAAGAKAGLF